MDEHTLILAPETAALIDQLAAGGPGDVVEVTPDMLPGDGWGEPEKKEPDGLDYRHGDSFEPRDHVQHDGRSEDCCCYPGSE